MRKIILHVADRNLNESQTELSERIKFALKHSDNFIDNHVIEYMEEVELKSLRLEHDSKDIHIGCPNCSNFECHPIDEQRHHLQTFDLQAWLNPYSEVGGGETEQSLLKCRACKEQFIQLWDYKEETEGIEWSYTCSSNVIWGSFDCGIVYAKTEEEAKKKAIEEITMNLEAINAKLEEIGQRVDINLDSLEVTKE